MKYPLSRRATDARGFTLVELLVVILIIGVLAAIALPSFLNQRGKAQDGEAKAKARTAQTALEIYYHEHDAYSGADKARLVALEPTLGDGTATLAEPVVAAATYTLNVTSQSGNEFTVAKAANGAVTRGCTIEGSNGCPQDGEW